MSEEILADTEYHIEDDAELDRIIFHIVSPELSTPKILMEVETPEDYSTFFIDRLRETIKGTKYRFQDNSWIKDQVRTALTSQHAFVDTSERLAEKFQELFQSDKRLIPGALMLLKIKNKDKTYGAIIKYDDMTVISYTTEVLNDGKAKPILNQFLNNFVQDKKAIQKSVLFDISCPNSSIICTDRSGSKGDITEKLKDFLQADRLFSSTLLTERLITALEETAKSQPTLIPPEIRKRLKSKIRQAVKDTVEFDPENHEQILTAAFGEAHKEDKIKKAFAASLKKQKISSEKFEISSEAIKQGSKRIKQTYEGVRVTYTSDDVNKNIFFEEDGAKKIIRIVTDQYVLEDESDD
ncbi:nucleoid-associated protein [Pseudomonas guariconensis]|uniref:nucleoid-associated protein n=1 Tax=Pseudomonas TaxID=286 RepID=UPI00215F3386|nr:MULTISPECIES: nucleoid-associated protein [unclassified Pseudomonas]MEC4559576.1 nucleoid-associated protein [Pseudomonas sp. CMAA1741]UVL04334.1 nucleoid-associated protein [Pseudomonas sp. B21-047]